MIIIGKSKSDYPYAVAYSESKSAAPIIISEGRGGQELIGAEITLAEALSQNSESIFPNQERNGFWILLRKCSKPDY